MTRAAILQMTSGIDPAVNAATLIAAVEDARAGGAAMLFTPEMSGLLDRDRERSAARIVMSEHDPVLAAVREAAAKAGIWVHLGSLAIRRPDGSLANRGFVIDAAGEVRAHYDKLHMFDVDLANGESWRESSAYTAGDWAQVVDTPLGRLGLSICYDLRFPALYAALAAAGADIFAIPAAFTRPTGAAHWKVLMRARAIENHAFVIAAAQSGEHEDGRATWGRSLCVGPWGGVLLDMGEKTGLGFAEIELTAVADAKGRVPVRDHRRDIPPVEITT